jgi:ankyrin repeat protein
MRATGNGRLKIVKELAAGGPDLNDKDDKYGKTAIMRAARNGHLEAVK